MFPSRTDINRVIGRLFLAFGYQVRRRGQGFHDDAFADQQWLLSGEDVGVILDLGANVGQTALRYRSTFPNAVIHCFEPFESTFESLLRNCRGDERIKLHRLAVADASGVRTFHHNANDATNSLLPNSAAANHVLPDSLIRPIGTVDVSTTTLDEFCELTNTSHVNILKIDIQGGELMALRGAARLLETESVDLIYSEVLFVELYNGQADFHEICRFLRQFDYTLYGMYELTAGRDSILAWCDAIFIAPRIQQSLKPKADARGALR
jgi:FkbM family methyltransferase